MAVCCCTGDDYVFVLDKCRWAGDGDDWGDGVGDGERVRPDRALVPCLVRGGDFDGMFAEAQVL